jgi:mono/diheme cytochrome c family protein
VIDDLAQGDLAVRTVWLAMAAAVLATTGCDTAPPAEYVASPEVLGLDAVLQERVRVELALHCGTQARPKLLGADETMASQLRLGQQVYRLRCATCHGESGDGAGPAAVHLNPRPRDYRRGVFKFTSTPYGVRPRREDLLGTLRRGVSGTSMPSFALLPDEELQAVLDYVLALTHRGELETLLALEASNEDELDPAVIPDLVAEVLGLWREAESQAVFPLTPPFPPTVQTIESGRRAFLTETAGCFKCHGADGRGQTSENERGFQDVWGHPTRAADLTSGMFRGGGAPEDIYRRIYSGINGTPMPSFREKLAAEPETLWHLVHYVQFVSAARRREVVAQQLARRPAATAPAAASDESGSVAPP